MHRKALIAGCVLALLAPSFSSSLGGAKNLVASLAQLPGLADTPDKGAFVDLVKAIGEVYTHGTITIGIFPFARSVNNVINGTADFHVPTVRNPAVDQNKLPYGTVRVPMGKVSFVIYSNPSKPLTRKLLDDAIAAKGKFPYAVEVPGGIENQFPFVATPSNDVEQSLQKVARGRIDALIWAQEEVDATLKATKLKNVRREFWKDFDDAIIIPKGPEGAKLDEVLSGALMMLKNNGRLSEIHSRVHHPYDEWQPANMGW